MQLNIPRTKLTLNISTLIKSHYSESPHVDQIKCSNCCKHDDAGLACPLTGICRPRNSVEVLELSKAPEYLFIQLIRYDTSAHKITTFVKMEENLVLPNNEEYELLATLNHLGDARNEGHYIKSIE